MLNGLYSGAMAIDMLAKQQEVIASNLMHVNTGGHRRLVASVSQRFDDQNEEALVDLGPEIDKFQPDFEPGRIELTDRPLDLSINGDGFFVLQQNGAEIYSRDGRFYRDAQTNQLVDHEGSLVLGENGPIEIAQNIPESDITVSSDGIISAAGQTLGTIRTVAFEDNSKLENFGPNRFVAGAEAVASDRDVVMGQFQRELSNVEPVAELVALIVNNRQFEAVQKATRTLSESLREYVRA